MNRFPVTLLVAALAVVSIPSPAVADREGTVLDKVNAARARGVSCGGAWQRPADALHRDSGLARSADRYAHTMAARGWFSHVGPGGSTLAGRARRAGYRGFAGGENIASGQPTAASVVHAWLASPGHCLNIMRRGYDEVGVGFARGAGGVTYWVLDFGYE